MEDFQVQPIQDIGLKLNALKNLAVANGLSLSIDDRLPSDMEAQSKIKQFEQWKNVLVEYKLSLDEYINKIEKYLSKPPKDELEWCKWKVEKGRLEVERIKTAIEVVSKEFFIYNYKGRLTEADKYTNTLTEQAKKKIPSLVQSAEQILPNIKDGKDKAKLSGLLQRCYKNFDGSNELMVQTLHDLSGFLEELAKKMNSGNVINNGR